IPNGHTLGVPCAALSCFSGTVAAAHHDRAAVTLAGRLLFLGRGGHEPGGCPHSRRTVLGQHDLSRTIGELQADALYETDVQAGVAIPVLPRFRSRIGMRSKHGHALWATLPRASHYALFAEHAERP